MFGVGSASHRSPGDCREIAGDCNRTDLREAEVDALEVSPGIDDLDAPDVLGVVRLALLAKPFEVGLVLRTAWLGADEVEELVDGDVEREARVEQQLLGLLLLPVLALDHRLHARLHRVAQLLHLAVPHVAVARHLRHPIEVEHTDHPILH